VSATKSSESSRGELDLTIDNIASVMRPKRVTASRYE
jgi:hypothetical protein